MFLQLCKLRVYSYKYSGRMENLKWKVGSNHSESFTWLMQCFHELVFAISWNQPVLIGCFALSCQNTVMCIYWHKHRKDNILCTSFVNGRSHLQLTAFLKIQNGCISECCIVLYSMHIVCGCIYLLSVLFYMKRTSVMYSWNKFCIC